jgi:hypothetical protein
MLVEAVDRQHGEVLRERFVQCVDVCVGAAHRGGAPQHVAGAHLRQLFVEARLHGLGADRLAIEHNRRSPSDAARAQMLELPERALGD